MPDRRKELSGQLRTGNDAGGPTGRSAGTYVPAKDKAGTRSAARGRRQ